MGRVRRPDTTGRLAGTRTGRRAASPLFDLRWGLERETQRIQGDGRLSPAPHPAALAGPTFTRDFAESQLEIVTRPWPSIGEVLAELEVATAVARAEVARRGELLWPFSMPPRIERTDEVRIAELGSNEAARRARQYREGLALRYGTVRQAICGVHVNVSVGARLLAWLATEAPLTREESHMGRPADGYHLRLARHLYAELPGLVLLTGASPLRGGDEDSSASPVLSHRNGVHGYGGSEYQSYLDLTSLEAYIAGVRRGLRTESATFARLGLVQDGRILQLNARVFQREKELYAPIRLRQALAGDETTLAALTRRGVGYLELRFLDVDPFRVVGVAEETLLLLHLLVLDGLTRPSQPRPTSALREDVGAAAAVASRNPLELGAGLGAGQDASLAMVARRLGQLVPWALRLDAPGDGQAYRAALASFARAVRDTRQLPASALLRRLLASGLDWTAFGVRAAERHAAALDLDLEREAALRECCTGDHHALEHAGL